MLSPTCDFLPTLIYAATGGINLSFSEMSAAACIRKDKHGMRLLSSLGLNRAVTDEGRECSPRQ